jgi:DDE domain
MVIIGSTAACRCIVFVAIFRFWPSCAIANATPASPGVWMKPTSKSKANGSASIVPSISRLEASTFSLANGVTLQPPAVLQFWRSGLICWADVPCIIGFRSVQVEAIRTGSHPSGGGLVPALFLVVPGCRGVARPSEASTPITSRCGVGLERYAPGMERRLRLRLRPTNDSWRVDETCIRVKGKRVYLYRAVDSNGATIDFLLLR